MSHETHRHDVTLWSMAGCILVDSYKHFTAIQCATAFHSDTVCYSISQRYSVLQHFTATQCATAFHSDTVCYSISQRYSVLQHFTATQCATAFHSDTVCYSISQRHSATAVLIMTALGCRETSPQRGDVTQKTKT
jgi:hypothetical protein